MTQTALTLAPVIEVPAPVTSGLNSPADLLARSMEFDALKVDYNEQLDKPWEFLFAPDMHLMPLDKQSHMAVQPAEMTQHAFSQLMALLGRTAFGPGSGKNLPTEYLWHIARQQAFQPALADLLNVHLGKRPGDLLVRTFDVGAPAESKFAVRAIMSDFYAPVSNTKMLKAFNDAYQITMGISGGTPQVVRSWIGPDDFHLKAVYYDVKPDQWHSRNPENQGDAPFGLGVMLSNSEIGMGSVKVLPVIQRNNCANSVIVDAGANSLNLVHRGDPLAMLDRVRSVVGYALDLSGKYLSKLIEMEEVNLPDFHAIISNMAVANKWQINVTNAVRTGAENQSTVAGLINGLTFAAHTEFNGQQTVDLERYAGDVLMDAGKTLKRFRA